MKERILIPEQMDDPELDRRSHYCALRGLQRINRWTDNASLAWSPIRQLAAALNRTELSVLDIATGSADIPIQLASRAKRAGINLQIDACDISPQALELAEESCNRAGLQIRLFTLDVLEDESGQNYDAPKYDIVMCSQFLHHLTDQQSLQVLTRMCDAAKYRIVVVDLIRSRLNLIQVWLASHVLSRSAVVHFDGLQSVRASYTIRELETIARRVGFDHFDIKSHWPCRLVLVGNKNGV